MCRLHSPAAVLAGLLAVAGLACGGNDSNTGPPPVTPTELRLVSGDNQGALRGDGADEPLRVRALGSDAQPAPGAPVRWAVTQGEATLEPTQSVTDVNGDTETHFTAGAALGDVLVSATLEGAAPVVFTVTTLDPCFWMKRLELETTATGVLRPLDCPDESGLFWDLYAFTVPTQQAVTIRTHADNFDTRSWLLNFNGLRFLGRAGMIDSTDTDHEAVVKVILAPGDYLAGASAFRVGTTGSYELRVSGTSAEAGSCEDEVWIVRGITTDQQLTPSDCVDSSGRVYQDAFSLILWAGERVSLTQTSSQFRPRLRLLRRSGAVLAEVDGTAQGAATIDFTADLARGEYIVVASSTNAQQSGAYGLAVTEPTAENAGAASVSEGSSSDWKP
jgi:Big-like domain-containing protein